MAFCPKCSAAMGQMDVRCSACDYDSSEAAQAAPIRERRWYQSRPRAMIYLLLAIVCTGLSLVAFSEVSRSQSVGAPTGKFIGPTTFRDPNYHPLDSRGRTYTMPPKYIPPTDEAIAKHRAQREEISRPLRNAGYAIAALAVFFCVAAFFCWPSRPPAATAGAP